eukprot:gnl/MRDRNA2_/MRDRNA2_183506_c0_seq1.p1 gnl/MRDRNA2_/MRDRNA2_183506_c0~~gnl/MRDRNA2_/MRDRNA2_183506_c0_seq1.p1  ORF type:complete len:374 (-),score=64.86 gnl/MRDRNA2_/MRDRNA2_183506_c0_seq1:7-1128(-)
MAMNSRQYDFLPQIVNALASTEAFALRVASRAASQDVAAALGEKKSLEFQRTIQGMPKWKEAPLFLHGVTHLSLVSGICPVPGMFSSVAEELTAIVALASRFPAVVRVDVKAHDVSILISRCTMRGAGGHRTVDEALQKQCFAVEDFTAQNKVAQEAVVWGKLLRCRSDFLRLQRDRITWVTQVKSQRAAACEMVGKLNAHVRSLVVHVIFTMEDMEQLVKDLRLLPRGLKYVTLVVWPPPPVGRGKKNAANNPSGVPVLQPKALLAQISSICTDVVSMEVKHTVSEDQPAFPTGIYMVESANEKSIRCRSDRSNRNESMSSRASALPEVPQMPAQTVQSATPRRHRATQHRQSSSFSGFGDMEAVWRYAGSR